MYLRVSQKFRGVLSRADPEEFGHLGAEPVNLVKQLRSCIVGAGVLKFDQVFDLFVVFRPVGQYLDGVE